MKYHATDITTAARRIARKTYAYAVIDGNQAPDQTHWPLSVHHTYEAAARAAMKSNNRDPNGHDYVLEWDASAKAQLPPNDRHYPCDRWIAAIGGDS